MDGSRTPSLIFIIKLESFTVVTICNHYDQRIKCISLPGCTWYTCMGSMGLCSGKDWGFGLIDIFPIGYAIRYVVITWCIYRYASNPQRETLLASSYRVNITIHDKHDKVMIITKLIQLRVYKFYTVSKLFTWFFGCVGSDLIVII